MDDNNLLGSHDWGFPIPIAYGPGRLREIADYCKRAGIARPLVVTDRGSRELPFIGQVSDYLKQAGLPSCVFSEVSPNPRDEEIADGRSLFRENSHDGVIAIGGGSGMDAGKSIALTARNNVDLLDFNFDEASPDLPKESFPPLICIPTTAGTGAETDSTAMITESRRLMKFCLWHPEFKPSLALLDPEVTLGLPSNLTAWTGFDAMIHAMEAYSVPGFHPLCDGLALESLRLIDRWLPEAISNGRNLEARGGMLVGSCLGGIAFLKGLGLVHAISHMVGAEYDTHHGLTNAVTLPAVMRFNEPEIDNKSRTMARAMQLERTSFEGLYAYVCNRLDEASIPKSLADIGVQADCSQRIAEKAIQDAAAATNPRSATLEEITLVMESALSQGR